MGISAYTKTAWSNGVAPAINATNLNKIEDRLFDLTEEIITPTMASTTTATQQIISLPSTTLKSRLDLTLAGNTYVNIVKNGNFTSTTGWSAVNSTHTVSNNILSNTGNGTSSSPYSYQSHDLNLIKTNDKIYQVATIRVTNADCSQIALYINDGSIYSKTQSTPVQNQLYKLSQIATITNVSPTVFRTYVRHYYVDSATANGKVMEVKEVMAINLTNLFGAGNEPTQAQADLMFANWFDGVTSTDRQIVKSVGKNLFDGTVVGLSGQVETKILSNSSFTLKALSSSGINVHNLFPKIKFRENTRYRIFYNFFEDDNTKNSRIQIYYTDGTFTTGTSPTLVLSASGFSSDANKTIKGISYNYSSSNGTTTYQDFQIQEYEETPYYEPYTETTAVMPVELKKISSTIFDKFNANSGQHTKNCSDFVNLTGNSLAISTIVDYVGYKRLRFTSAIPFTSSNLDATVLKYNNKKIIKSNLSTPDVDGYYLGNANSDLYLFVSDSDTGFLEAWDSATSFTGMTFSNLQKAYMNGWKLTTANTNVASCVWTGIASGTTQSGASGYSHVIANIDAGYTPYRMIYPLATPIITNYYPNTLTAEPSGTIYTYPFVADYDFYDTGAGVNNTAFPIDSLEYVNIVDKATGALTPVDLSTCTVASGGLSFTSTALTADDLVDFGYTYKDLTTVADVIYSHPTDLKATVDGNTNNIRDLDEKIEQSNTFTTLTLKEIERDARILKIMGGI